MKNLLIIALFFSSTWAFGQSTCEQIMTKSDEIKELVVESITSKNTYEINRYLEEALVLMNESLDLIDGCNCDGVFAMLEDMIGDTKWALESSEWEEQREVAKKLEDWCYDLKRLAKKCSK